MEKDKTKILVTGGAGFIGSHLIPRLLSYGYSVTVLDNLSTGKLDNLSKSISSSNFKLIKADIRDKASLAEAFQGVSAVIHLAALIDVAASVIDPLETHEVNVTGTLNLLQEAVRSNVKRFVFASSTAVYGDAKNLPVNENSIVKPISPYAASKAAAEAYCTAFAGCYGLAVVALRFFNVYGLGNENNPYSGVITKFLQKAVNQEALLVNGDGEQTRDFIHVSDVVSALICALESKEVNGGFYNVCTGVPISINRLVSTLREVIGNDLQVIHGPARQGDIRFSYGDPAKSKKSLGFKSSVNLTEGLKLLLGSLANESSK